MSEAEERPDGQEPAGGPEEKEKEELREAQEVARLHEEGLTVERIAERMGMSESTVRRRLELWERHIGAEPADREDIDRVVKIITDFFGSDDVAERIGEVTGTNVAVVKGILERIYRGEATKAELSRLLHNIKGGILG